ncbi:MAG: hypothetical protein ABIQ03_04360 [Burkholderiales bacterium]
MSISPNCIRVFLAATKAEWLPARVLEFSIRETTALPVEITRICDAGRKIPMPRATKNRPKTPFSFQRFLVPELCGYKGKAIYLDSDMQVFRDISQLWIWPLDDCDLQTVFGEQEGRRGQFSVMLLDCERLRWNIDDIVAQLDAGILDYAGLMYKMRVVNKIGLDISPHWNGLECFDPDRTCLLHYTDMNTQPWISAANRLGHLWVKCLRRALASGFISGREIEREINDGHVRPSLSAEIDSGIDGTTKLSQSIRRLDRGFLAPYRHLNITLASPWMPSPRALLAAIRRRIVRST